MPKGWCKIPHPDPEERTYWGRDLHGSVGFGDASGGEHTADPRLRRVGWSYVTFDPETWSNGQEPLSGSSGGLPGDIQTVNRGELWALGCFLADTSGDGTFVTDSQYVYRGFQ